MVVSLTLNANQDVSSTLSTANQLVSTQTGTTSSAINTKIGTAFGVNCWGQIYAKGNTGAWPALGAIGAPDGNGWLLDNTSLEAQQIVAGNWQWIEKSRVTAGTATVDMVVRYYKRSSGGTYTLIVSITLAAQAFTATGTVYTSAATAGLLTNFVVGDKLYKDVWYNCTANSGAGSSTNFALQECNNAGLGLSNIAQATTPGYQPTPVVATSPTTLSFTATTGGASPASQNSTLSETAGTSTAWTSNIVYGSGSGWLAISPTSGTLSASGNQVVAFTCTTGALAAGTYTATVTFTATNGGATATVGVTFVVTPVPVLATSPATLSFSAFVGGTNPVSQNDTLSETAGASTAWTSSISYGSGSGWLAISPTSGSLSASGNATIGFTCTTGSLAIGIYTATVTFTATTGGATTSVTVTFGVAVFSSGSIEDRNLYKQQIVRIYDSAGNYRGLWPDAPLLTGFKTTINGGTTALQVSLPRAFDNFGQTNFPGSDYTVVQGNIVEYTIYGPGLPNTGLVKYVGILDKIEPSIDSPKEEVMVTLTPYSSVLGDHGATVTVTFTNADPIDMFNYWFTTNDPATGKPYAYPLTLDPSNPVSSGVTCSYPCVNQTLDSVFQTILTMLPANFFYRINVDKSVTLNQAPTTAQHIFYLGQHLSKPKYSQDWTGLKNDIVVNGNAGATARRTGSDISTFGQRLLFKQDTRLTTNTMCGIVAQGLLTVYDQVLFRSPITLVDYRGDAQPVLGVDIEAILPGDTVEIIDTTGVTSSTTWDNFLWDNAGWDFTSGALFNTVVTVFEVSYNWDTIEISLGAPRPNLSKALLALMSSFSDFTMTQ